MPVGLYIAHSPTTAFGRGWSTSPDGTTWTLRDSTRGVTSILAGSKLLASSWGGGAGTVSSSTDALTFTNPGSFTLYGSYRDLGYIGSRLVAIAESGTRTLIYSDDNGVTWATTGATTQVGANLASSGSILVAAGCTSNLSNVRVSTDGLAWTSYAVTTGLTGIPIVFYNGSVFVAISRMGAVYTSPTGVTWTYSSTVSGLVSTGIDTFARARFVKSSAYGSSVWVFFCELHASGYSLNYSLDGGLTWTSVPGPLAANFAVNGQTWITLPADSTAPPGYISTNGGSTFTSFTAPSGVDGRFVRVDYIDNIGTGSAFSLPKPVLVAGVYAKGRAAARLPALYYPLPPSPNYFWTRSARTREIT